MSTVDVTFKSRIHEVSVAGSVVSRSRGIAGSGLAATAFFGALALAWAASAASPPNGTFSSCAKKLPPWETLSQWYETGGDSALSAVQLSCRELGNSWIYTDGDSDGSKLETASDLSQFSALVSSQAPKLRARFVDELSKIEKIPSLMERVRATYWLLSRFQGQFDFGGISPEKLPKPIATAAARNEAGSSLYVAGALVHALSQALAKEVKSGQVEVLFISGLMPGPKGFQGVRGFDYLWRGWVRLTIKVGPSLGESAGEGQPGSGRPPSLVAQTFDLDVSMYPGQFTALLPRRRRLEERQRWLDQCVAMKTCLRPVPLAKPTPRQF